MKNRRPKRRITLASIAAIAAVVIAITDVITKVIDLGTKLTITPETSIFSLFVIALLVLLFLQE